MQQIRTAVMVVATVAVTKKRPLSGVLLFDKSTGFSSNQALQIVKRLYRAEKTGHTGTLDPLASGLLPLMFGEATKFAADLIDASKTYRTTVRLGFSSNTGDAEGEILERKAVTISQAQVDEVIAWFTGAIEQIPPMYSALKHQGKPLYELARQGINIERAPRPVTIYSLKVLGSSFEGSIDCGAGEAWIDIEAKVSKGTYIRTLIDDLGEALGSGAYVSALRRIHVGPFDAAQMLTQEQLVPFNEKQDWAGLDALLLPMDLALTGLPELKLREEQQKRLVHGQTVLLSESELADLGMESAGAIKLYGPAQQFIGVASLEAGVLSVRRLLNTSVWQTPAL